MKTPSIDVCIDEKTIDHNAKILELITLKANKFSLSLIECYNEIAKSEPISIKPIAIMARSITYSNEFGYIYRYFTRDDHSDIIEKQKASDGVIMFWTKDGIEFFGQTVAPGVSDFLRSAWE